MTQLQESEEKVKSLNENLSAALSEINTKESLVKEHAKVAEELMSGRFTLVNYLLPFKHQDLFFKILV